MELEHLTFVEVLERLANRANIPIARGEAFTVSSELEMKGVKNYMKLVI